MNPEDLKEKIQIAKDAVKDQQEPYKTEAFKIILSSLLGNTTTGTSGSKHKPLKSKTIRRKSHQNSNPPKLEQKNELSDLAKQCNITPESLSEVLTIKNNIIHIIKHPQIQEKQKHVLFGLCILAAYTILYEAEWISSLILKKALDSSGVGDLKHSAESIGSSSLIVARGEAKAKEYKITGKGLIRAFDIISKLSKDESIIEN